MTQPPTQPHDDRREFLKNCGKFAVTVPPAMTILLSTSLSSPALAASSDHGAGIVELDAADVGIVETQRTSCIHRDCSAEQRREIKLHS